MRILHVTMTFPPKTFGGATAASFNMAVSAARRGHSVTVFTSDLRDRTSRIGSDWGDPARKRIMVRYYANLSNRLASERFFTPIMMIPALAREVGNFDIVHLHDFRSVPSIFLHTYAKQRGIPYVLQAHGAISTLFQRGVLKTAYDRAWGSALISDAARLIATSPMEANQYVAAGGKREQIAIIPNGIDRSEYETLPSRGALRNQLGLSDTAILILFLGRIHRAKGVDTLVDAFREVLKGVAEAHLVMAGPDDGYLARVKKRVAAAGVGERVHFVGSLRGGNKLSAFVDSDLFVLPSLYEIFGIVAFEALACETPVLMSESCGTAPLILAEKIGYVARAGDVMNWAERIMDLVQNRDAANAAARKGREFVLRNLSWDVLAERLERVYQESWSES